MACKSALDTFTENLAKDLCCLQDRIVELCKEVLNPLELEAALLRGHLGGCSVQKEQVVPGSPTQADNPVIGNRWDPSAGSNAPATRKSATIVNPGDITLESTDEHLLETIDTLTPLVRWECMVFGLLDGQSNRDKRAMDSVHSAQSASSSIDESMIDEYWGMHSTWSLRPNSQSDTRCEKTAILPAPMRTRKFATMSMRGFGHTPEHHGDVLRDEHRLRILQAFALNPDGWQRWSWAVLGVAVLALDLIIVPMHAVGMVHGLPESVNIATWVYWLFDLPCELLTGVHRDGLVDMRPSTTISKYAKTWLLPDLALLALDFLMLFMEMGSSYSRAGESLRAVRIIRILRVIRAHKLREMQKMIETYIFSTHLMLSIQLFWLVLCMLTFNHWVACVWYGISAKSYQQDTWLQIYTIEQDDDQLHSYLAALHWSLCQFSPATNNIAPQNPMERGFAICIAIFGLVVFSSFVSNVTNAVNQLKVLSLSKLRERTRMQEFLQRIRITTELGRRIQMFFDTNFNKCSRPVQEQDITAFLELPESLRIRLHQEAYFPALHLTVIYTLCDYQSMESLTRMCHTAMSECYYCASQDVFVDGTECHTMYYVKSGRLQYHPVSSRQDMLALQVRSAHEVSSGSWLSEAVLWLRWVHAGRLAALVPSTLVLLSSSSVRDIVAKTRDSLFKSMRMYAILFVSYFEELNECNYCLTDLPIPSLDSKLLVDRALRLKEGLNQGALNVISDSQGVERGSDFFWTRWVTVIPHLPKRQSIFNATERLKSRMSLWNSRKSVPEGPTVTRVNSTLSTYSLSSSCSQVFDQEAHHESASKMRDCKADSDIGKLSL